MKTIFFGLIALAANLQQANAADKGETPAAPAETKRVRWAKAPPVKQNTYRVHRLKQPLTIDADWDKPAWKDIPSLTIEYYMGQAPEHQPQAQAKVAYDEDALYLIWKVADQFVLAKRTRHQDDVWRDSCVEFFFTPGTEPAERGYFNLETNCTGVKLLGIHHPGSKDDQPTAADFASIVTASSLQRKIDPELAVPTTWTLEYKIPLSLVQKYAKVDLPQRGVRWRANFYKCADDASHPHWLTWSPVANTEPSFHLPQFFGILEFE